jgi:hypothetical protein
MNSSQHLVSMQGLCQSVSARTLSRSAMILRTYLLEVSRVWTGNVFTFFTVATNRDSGVK